MNKLAQRKTAEGKMSLAKHWKNVRVRTAFFLKTTWTYFCLGLLEECPSYRRSLQPSKESIEHSKYFFLFICWEVIFAHLDADRVSDLADQNQMRTRIHKTTFVFFNATVDMDRE